VHTFPLAARLTTPIETPYSNPTKTICFADKPERLAACVVFRKLTFQFKPQHAARLEISPLISGRCDLRFAQRCSI
jgi:hypothetical protein